MTFSNANTAKFCFNTTEYTTDKQVARSFRWYLIALGLSTSNHLSIDNALQKLFTK